MNQRLSHRKTPITLFTGAFARRHFDALLRTAAPVPQRHAKWLCVAILVGATTQPASACPNLSNLPAPAEAGNIIGASDTLDSAHLQSRVQTDPYVGTNSVPGGEYAGVAVDGILYEALRNEGSDTVNATAVNNFRSELNAAVKPKRKFVSGHLVNQEFGGNRASGNNFSTITSKTNSAMSSHGEGSAKSIMTSIHSKYHGDNASSAWVGRDNSGPLPKRYKPGILYETEITSDQSVLDYENATGDTLIADTRIKPAQRAKLAASLQTRMRFIMHEYELDVNGNNPSPTGNWYDMPQNVFDQYVGDSGAQLGVSLPPEGDWALETGGGRDSVTVEPYFPPGSSTQKGIQITWEYWNVSSDPN